jgi:hypothetical protein
LGKIQEKKNLQGILKNGTPARASIPFFETPHNQQKKNMLDKMSSGVHYKTWSKVFMLMRRCTFCFALGKSPEKLSAPECPIAEQTEQTILLLFTKEYHIVHIVAGMWDIPEMQN